VARPREFDYDDVVEKAMHLFWRQGYQSTSIDEIETATGLTKGSLYKAFELLGVCRMVGSPQDRRFSKDVDRRSSIPPFGPLRAGFFVAHRNFRIFESSNPVVAFGYGAL
jgi:hypothetical protein